ncbi:MAG: amidohydrolase family protein [Candidatus Heimdallarchaeaceae archaeon]
MVRVKDTIIEADYLITSNPSDSILKDAAILVVDSEIAAIGTKKEIHKDYSASQIISGENKILMPGLVNTHSHSVQTLLRGKADDLALLDWLEKVVIPGESNFSADDVHTSSLLGFAEMIRTGTTTTNDMLSSRNAELGIKSAIEVGIRTRIGQMLMDVNPSSPTERIESADEIIETINQQIANFHYTHNERIKYTLNARFLLSCSPELMKGIVETQQRYDDLMIHTHASESQAECREVEKYYKNSYVRALRDVGALGSETIIAHGIWLDEEEYTILKETETRLTHNPSSNCKLASGICDVKKHLDLGIIVGLGTDGAPCNNNLDMFREIRLATFLQKVKHLDEKLLPAKQVLRMATIDGARAINWDKEIGSIEKGKRADVVQIDIGAIDAIPIYDPISHVVYSASGKDVSMTMIDGKIVYRDNKFNTFNFENLKNKVNQYKEKWTN